MCHIYYDNSMSADIVIVGGGPIGLWAAIQIKSLCPDKTVVVREKHAQYQRHGIHLRLVPSSFAGCTAESVQPIVQDWKRRHVIPIAEMEQSLAAIAESVGVQITRNQEVDPAQILQEFPHARIVIGADGSHSPMRQHFFADTYRFMRPLQYLVQVQYKVRLSDASQEGCVRSVAEYKKQKFAGHLITQTIRSCGDQTAEIAMRIFVDKTIYDEMADARFSAPYYFETDLHKVPDRLKQVLIRWWGSHPEQEILQDEARANKITVIALAAYSAKQFVQCVQRPEGGESVAVALVGDAAQAYPYFRAINNGLLNATALAIDTARALQQPPNPTVAPLHRYARYARFRSIIELVTAYVKNFFIHFSNCWIRVSGTVFWESAKLSREEQAACTARGQLIWDRLSAQASA